MRNKPRKGEWKMKETEQDLREVAANIADKLILFDGNSNFYDYHGKRVKWLLNNVCSGKIDEEVAALALLMFFDSKIESDCDGCADNKARTTFSYKNKAAVGCKGGMAILDMLRSATIQESA
jgi:hypothetical protein